MYFFKDSFATIQAKVVTTGTQFVADLLYYRIENQLSPANSSLYLFNFSLLTWNYAIDQNRFHSDPIY